MTTINQLLHLIEVSGMTGTDKIMLRIGETIAPMESCTFQEHEGKTALMFQGGRKQLSQETRARPEHTAAHDCACEECMAAETRGDALPIPDFLRNQENLRAEQAVPKSDSVAICCDCPPLDYPTDKTRCAECPRLNRLSSPSTGD